MRNNRVNNRVVNNNVVLFMDKKLRLISLKENYSARVEVYVDVLGLLIELDALGKQKLSKETKKQLIEINKIDELKEFLWLVNSLFNDFEMLVKVDFKQYYSGTVSMRVHEELLKYLNSYRCILEHIADKLNVLGNRGKVQVNKIKEIKKVIEKIIKIENTINKLLYQ